MADSGLRVWEKGDGVEFEVRVSAGSVKAGVRGVHGGALKVAVNAPPERGKANAEALKVIAGWLRVPAGRVAVLSGQASRRKRVRVAGVTVDGVQARTQD